MRSNRQLRNSPAVRLNSFCNPWFVIKNIDWVKSLLYFSIADCLPSGVKLKTLRKDGMKSKSLTFGVRDKIAMPSAWGLAKVALSAAIKSGIASLHANSPAARLNSPWGIGEMNGLRHPQTNIFCIASLCPPNSEILAVGRPIKFEIVVVLISDGVTTPSKALPLELWGILW